MLNPVFEANPTSRFPSRMLMFITDEVLSPYMAGNPPAENCTSLIMSALTMLMGPAELYWLE